LYLKKAVNENLVLIFSASFSFIAKNKKKEKESMLYSRYQTIEAACQEIDKKHSSITNPIRGKVNALTGKILRISLSYEKKISTVKVITKKTAGRWFFFFKETFMTETTFLYRKSHGWERQYPYKTISKIPLLTNNDENYYDCTS
jgi:hypothetical protein